MRKPRPGRANWILAGLIAAFGLAAFCYTVSSGRADSALLFVVLPALLAAALALTPGRTTHGRVFRLTTIALLLAAVALHEGAICVLIASPLVYAVAHGTAAVIRMARQGGTRALAILPLPLLLAGGIEGTSPDLRIRPDQSVEVSRVVALDPAAVRERLAAGPRPVAVGPLPLRLLGAPAPEHVMGAGLEPGDRWMFGYHGSSHGAGGAIVTRVRAAEPRRIDFDVVSDDTITARWLRWRGASVRWHDAGAGRTEVTVVLSYQRRLDPSWYFGPIQDRLMHAGGEHLLDMLALP
ncbi:hypothetical protein ACFQFC_07250 [Amorphoplanes digitatis]|uniref:Polyketide cyclase/dehydrase n=1 Tax=Actinoplanes digitatis TaxID=1868 RepID=A0A7W7I059_9ACTN|nr:hypothetical protein [Actinoplanes digitatis]GID93817.1 hypothetical protein Adi01nite_32290 [Actinoplanes digitatis]